MWHRANAEVLFLIEIIPIRKGYPNPAKPTVTRPVLRHAIGLSTDGGTNADTGPAWDRDATGPRNLQKGGGVNRECLSLLFSRKMGVKCEWD